MLGLGRSQCKHQHDASLHMEEALQSLDTNTTQRFLSMRTDRPSTGRQNNCRRSPIVKSRKFHFPTDFIVVDYVVDPWVPLILGRPFLRTARALIDVCGEELTTPIDDCSHNLKVGQNFEIHHTMKLGAKNLAADHLSRLENPHQGDLEKKEINETFPLETLGMISFRGDVFTAKKPLISSWLAILDPPGDIMVPTTLLKKSLILVFIGLLFTKMPMTWSHGVTLVNVKAKSRNVMKCLKMHFKFARSLTCGASILWDRSRLLEGANTFSWPSTTCTNGLKKKRSPLVMPELL
ncbi:reverse transcriptase domain-containing protein [Tanacetum coccineum]